MAQVETARGPVDADRLGTTLMHEHVFVLNEEIRLNYPGDWDEEARVADAAGKLNALRQRGCDTIVDPTVLGLGRDIRRIQRVAAGTDINIIVATGLYTYDDVPFYFRYRGPQRQSASSDPMTAMFVADITEGISGTGVKAAFLKCAIEEQGLTPGVQRVLRAVGSSSTAPGASRSRPGNSSRQQGADEPEERDKQAHDEHDPVALAQGQHAQRDQKYEVDDPKDPPHVRSSHLASPAGHTVSRT
jgi:phosphotriesterase-related protein